MSIITNHADKRMRKRCGINRKAVARMADKALDNGTKREDTRGILREWLDGKHELHPFIDNMMVYGDKCYMFCDNVLITVLTIPTVITMQKTRKAGSKTMRRYEAGLYPEEMRAVI